MTQGDRVESTMLKLKQLSRMLPDLSRLELSLGEKGYSRITGVDEAGRGPLAGPVVAAAVMIPPGVVIQGLDDSKKLSPARRDELFDEIAASGAQCTVGIIDNYTIDRMNILKASLMAMRKAVTSLGQPPDFVLVDGNYTIPNLDIPQFALVAGDAICASIAAASIIAKVTRDRIMDKYEELYPEFSFSCHRGYPTRKHFEELKEYGPTDIHRRSFRPVEEILKQSSLKF
ncbi:MAG: ribonuclease HII [Candidatus Zixiibacteriota bacterium]|nr:MAG: ribonuclease HII [candidate division Zixibacteria bacterium]